MRDVWTARSKLSEVSISPSALTLAVSAYVIAVLNWPFWTRLYAAAPPAGAYDWAFFAGVFMVVLASYNVVLTLFAYPRLLRPIIAIVLVLSAVVSFYMSSFGILVDPAMLRNVLETDPGEARDLLNFDLLLFVGGLGVLPAVAVWAVPIAWPPLRVRFVNGAFVCGASIVVVGAIVFAYGMNFASVFRQHRELRHALVPFNAFSALQRTVSQSVASRRVLQKFATDAVRKPGIAGLPPKSVTILVIGETARAANFSLNGYERDTNPRLSKVDGLINFSKATSCGTSTAQSLPCIFSGLGRTGYNSEIAVQQEGLLDILQRAGLSVLWRENQSGCKDVCARVPTENLKTKNGSDDDTETHDEALLSDLKAKIAAMPGDGVIVLHMMGSHGPLYYKRYPAAFEAFTPVCTSSKFSSCASSEIVNAYDNTILYTDHVLAELIGILSELNDAGTATAMLYASDHGESLGENGIYLHGLPYAIAPDVQKHVPMMIWMSQAYSAKSHIDRGCLAAKRETDVGHDNIFHSMLGLADIETAVYRPELDLFASCRAIAASSDARQGPLR